MNSNIICLASSDGPSVAAEASALPVSDKPVTLSFNKVGISLKSAGTQRFILSCLLRTPLTVRSAAGPGPSQAALLLSSNDDDEADSKGSDSHATSAEDLKGKYLVP